MTLEQFDNELNLSWDNAIEKILTQTSNNAIKLLTDIYKLGYKDSNYDGEDVDTGLCFEIRKFAIEQIRKICK